MKIHKAKLARREIGGVDVVVDTVALGKEYYADMDSVAERLIGQRNDNGIGAKNITDCRIVNVCCADGTGPAGRFPLELLDVDPEEIFELEPAIMRKLADFDPPL